MTGVSCGVSTVVSEMFPSNFTVLSLDKLFAVQVMINFDWDI